jgi:hypothetical protein
MTQPLGNCPGCGTDEPFEQFHPDQCPDVDGECPEWACVECGAAVIMGTAIVRGAIMGTLIAAPATAGAPAGPSVRAA